MIEKYSKIHLLEAIAQAWNRAGVNYAVAHGLERYPNGSGRDLDILVESRHVAKAIEIARKLLYQHGLVVAHPPPLWGERLVAFRDGTWDDAIEIHTIPRLSWRNVTFATKPESSRLKGPFKVDPWVSFAKRVLTPLLGGEAERFMRKPEELSIAESERETIISRLQFFCGQQLAQRVCAAIDHKDVQGLQFLLPQLRRSLSLRAFMHTPLISLRVGWRSIWRKFAQFFAPCSPIIALVGPDGVGKSTLLEIIASSDSSLFTKIVVRHWRPGILPGLNTFVRTPTIASRGITTSPRRDAGRFHWLRLCYYACDFLLGHILKNNIDASRQRLVLYDRCALDMAVDPVRYGLSSGRGTQFLWQVTPKPDKVILLYDDANGIHARKPELPVEEIQRQLQTWLWLAERGELDAIVRIDAPAGEIAERVKSLIMEAFAEKNREAISSRNEHVQWLASILSNDGQNSTRLGGRPVSSVENPQGKHNQKYGMFTIKDGRAYLIPLGLGKGAVQALNLYNAQTLKAKVAKRLLAVGLQLGFAQYCLRKVHLRPYRESSGNSTLNWHLLEHVKQIMGRQDLQFGISLGTPGSHRKPVLQALTPDGSTLGFIKVGWNEKTNTLVQNEAQILRRLESAPCSSFMAPTVLHEAWWDGDFFCLLSPPVGRVAVAPQTLTPQYLAAQNELIALHTRWMPLKKSRFWADLSQRIAIVQNAYYRYVLQQGAYTVETWLGDTPLPFHLSHGDFAPWNARMLNGRLLLFDWEYSTIESPAGYDLLHFTVQTARLLRKWSPGQTCQSIQRTDTNAKSITENLEQVGLKGVEIKPLLLLYVLERLAFYASEHDTSREALRFFSHMANLLILKEPSTQCPPP